MGIKNSRVTGTRALSLLAAQLAVQGQPADRRYEENLKELQQRLFLKQLCWEASVRAALFPFKAALKLRLSLWSLPELCHSHAPH